MGTIEIFKAFDFAVIGRFPEDELFWEDVKPNTFLTKRKSHLDSRAAYLIVGGRNNVDLAAGGTRLLAFVCPEPVPPTWSFWSIQVDNLDNAKLLALWWNSSFHLAQLIENRAEVGGAWMGWLKDVLFKLLVLNYNDLSVDQKKELISLYDTIKYEPFPSLLHQFKSRYEHRILLDTTLAEIMELKEYTHLKDITRLYDRIIDKIDIMKEIMTRN